MPGTIHCVERASLTLSRREPGTDEFQHADRGAKLLAHVDLKYRGIALSRTEALSSNFKGDFFDVADYIVLEDPAVTSHLMEQEGNVRGRVCQH
jgi:hypothetical protein